MRRQGNTFDGDRCGAAVAGQASTPASTLARRAHLRRVGVRAAAFTLFALTWDRLGGGSGCALFFVVAGMTVLIAATAKAVLMRVGAPFVGFAAMAVLQENEFSPRILVARQGLVVRGYIARLRLCIAPKKHRHPLKNNFECIRIVLYAIR